MAFDRDSTLKQGEKFLRQGRLDAAIREYARVVEAQPRDWNTANLLGDLHFRAGQVDESLAQYHRIADHLMREGFFAKATALYKKVLKIRPDEESTQLLLADLSTRQGLVAEAKRYLTTVGDRRRARGDREGVADIAIRLGSLDPSDFGARLEAARTLEDLGQSAEAAARFRAVYADLQASRPGDALDALRQAVRLNPDDREGRTILARETVAAGDVLGARDYLDRETAGNDPALLSALVELDLRSGHIGRARDLMTELLAADRDVRRRLLVTAWALCESDPEAAHACIDAIADSAIAIREYAEAAEHLQAFAERRPGHVPTLLKLVDVSVDGGLDAPMYQAQIQLADAYLDAGQALEARVIAEDLVAREPWERAHIERFRRALVLLEVEDPDAVVADRLSGDTPFMNDAFMDLSTDLLTEPTDAEPVDVADPEATIASGASDPVVEEQPLDAAIDEPAVEEQPLDAAIDEPAPAEDAAHALVEESIEDEVILDFASPEAPAPADLSAALSSAAEATLSADAEVVAGAATESSPDPLLEEVDITGILGDLDHLRGDKSSTDLDAAFDDLRSEAELDAEFGSQYLKLASTYIDMGMMDDAMTALRTAAETPALRFEAASMLGRLHTQRGETAQAIQWLEQAAEEPAPNLVEGRALLYDLGVMLDRNVEYSRALAVFLELQADAGDYRDVPARIDRLARVQTGG